MDELLYVKRYLIKEQLIASYDDLWVYRDINLDFSKEYRGSKSESAAETKRNALIKLREKQLKQDEKGLLKRLGVEIPLGPHISSPKFRHTITKYFEPVKS